QRRRPARYDLRRPHRRLHRHRRGVLTATGPPSRLKAGLRVAGVALKALATILLFLTTSVIGLLLHLERPAAKRLLRTEVHGVLDGTLKGQVRLVSWRRISLDGVLGLHGQVFAPDALPGEPPVLEFWDAD